MPSQRTNSAIQTVFSDRYTFSKFVIGRSNELATAAAMAVAATPGKAYNPLFIYGATGLGKTHLMQAIAHEILAKTRHCRVMYISTEQFTNDVITSIARRAMHDFRRRYRETDLLLVDDVHFLGGKETTQEEFFHTFNAVYEAGRQIVLTSDRPPSEIPGSRHVSSAGSNGAWSPTSRSPTSSIASPSCGRRRRLDHLEHTIPDDVLHFIADHVQANVRELEGSIIKLLAFASLKHRVVTVDLAREALRDKLKSNDVAPPRSSRHDRLRTIQQRVAAEWGVTVDGLQAKTRTKVLTVPRQVAMYLARNILGMQLVEIGQRVRRTRSFDRHPQSRTRRGNDERELGIPRDRGEGAGKSSP